MENSFRKNMHGSEQRYFLHLANHTASRYLLNILTTPSLINSSAPVISYSWRLHIPHFRLFGFQGPNQYSPHLHTKLTKKALNLIPVSIFRIGISSQTLIIPDKGRQGQDLLCTLCGPLFGSEKFLSVKKY